MQTATSPSLLLPHAASSVASPWSATRPIGAPAAQQWPVLKCNVGGRDRSVRAQAEKAARGPIGEYGERVMVGDAGEEEAAGDEEMAIKLECDESGCVLVVGRNVPTLDDDSQGYLQCNLTGCFYDSAVPVAEFRVLEGSGWRLGYETAPANEEAFCAMVGAGGWSVALTASEFNDFCKLVQMLRKGLITMDQDGVLNRDDIVMQVERGNLWMECVVARQTLPTLQRFLKMGGRPSGAAFAIRFILSGTDSKRQAEGFWPAEAVMDMLAKMDELSAPSQPTTGSSSSKRAEPVTA
ncbi:hypothetical protein CLOM_g3353 [Closterium sp. NIES-68]|nr:hypothetical protein CLOM_g3353 [Closterium sp. NIES-68]GJP81624.1 hypothetical protein CLOP_g11781 [Closterium sp. NIES-67]